MARLEDLTRGATIQGILPDHLVTVVDVKRFGSNVIALTYKDATGQPRNELLYRDREPTFEIVTAQGSNKSRTLVSWTGSWDYID